MITGVLIWSLEHGAWWRPGEWGYTRDRSEAGIYSLERATEICLRANIVTGNQPNEAMVPFDISTATGMGRAA